MSEAARQRVIAEARSWLGTPYHHAARVKGAGVDCAMLLAEVYEKAGVVDYVDLGYYPHDWHLHRSDERFLAKMQTQAVEIQAPPQPADIVVVKFGRCFSHGAIVIDWPTCIHAYIRLPVGYTDVLRDAIFRDGPNLREMKFFTLWPAS